MKHTPPDKLADIILNSRHRKSVPIQGEPNKRLVGWVIDADDAGLSDALFALEEIERRARQNGSTNPATTPVPAATAPTARE